MSDKVEQLAVIRNFKLGVGDRDVPVIMFDAFLTEGTAALQCIYGAEEIHQFIADAEVSDITKMNGRTCWVETDGFVSRFLRLAKI